MPKSILTVENENFIKENFLLMSNQDIADVFGCSEAPISRYKKKAGLIVPKETSRQFAIEKAKKRTSCSPEDDKFIKDNFIEIPPQKMADILGCSETKVKTRIRQLGLLLPPEVLQKRINDFRIKTGCTPPNKGKKQVDYMSKEAIERTKGTRFKKGDIPANSYNEIGKITTRLEHPNRKGGRSYKYICLKLGVWVPLHVHNWTKKNGPVPKGYCLWFKDTDSLNSEIENLELITRAENLARNNMSNGAIASKLSRKGYKTDQELKQEILKHPELIELKKQQLTLNRAIKNERAK